MASKSFTKQAPNANMYQMRAILLWIIAGVLMGSAALYQRRTGPTYPIEGSARLGPSTFDYSLARSHGGGGYHPVIIEHPDPEVTGLLVWKRYKFDEPLHRSPMERIRAVVKTARDGSTQIHPVDNETAAGEVGSFLIAYLPHQPPAGKLEYEVLLTRGAERLILPETSEAAVIRFKGAVPLAALLPHIIIMFTAMLLAVRTAMAALVGERAKPLAWATLIALGIGGLILGPIVQKHAFGAYWTGWPLGEDLTDDKTAVVVLMWVFALVALRGPEGERRGRWWSLAAAVVLLLVYLIPHSMRGSELDYSQLDGDSLRSPPPAVDTSGLDTSGGLGTGPTEDR